MANQSLKSLSLLNACGLGLMSVFYSYARQIPEPKVTVQPNFESRRVGLLPGQGLNHLLPRPTW
jgi:hypothetical protein